jgi:hypothetical protein
MHMHVAAAQAMPVLCVACSVFGAAVFGGSSGAAPCLLRRLLNTDGTSASKRHQPALMLMMQLQQQWMHSIGSSAFVGEVATGHCDMFGLMTMCCLWFVCVGVCGGQVSGCRLLCRNS